MIQIKNANKIPLNQNPGTLPNMQGAMLDWFQILTFTQIKKVVENFNLIEKTYSTSFQGVKQPFTAQELMMKPEGQRSWKWFTIHAFPDLVLTTDEIINFGGENYRVMQKSDFTEYGYVMYQICQDYTK